VSVPPAAHPFLDHPGPIAFAHRGGAGLHPENTLAAFAAAVELGYRYVETDVHVTSDGVVVAFHDDRLERVTDGRGRIAELAWSDVAGARVAGTEPIPRLEELLATWPDLRINIDPKHDAAVVPLASMLQARRALDRVCIGSFSERRLAAVREALGPRCCTSLGPRGVVALRARAWGIRRRGPGRATAAAPARAGRAPAAGRAHCVQVPTRHRGIPLVDRRLIAAAGELDLPVHVWTVDDPAEMNRLLDLGVGGIMTDRPERLRAVLERRGAWIEQGGEAATPASAAGAATER
jgi:glycerophosphoryl diester phosphodiesterase